VETIKILFFSANTDPGNRYLDIEEEYHHIEEKIRASEYRDRLQLIPAFAARPDDWLQQLNQHRPHIVQFSGHGNKEGSLLMVGSLGPVEVPPNTLKELFTTLKDNVRLVVLNACYSKKQAEAISEVIDCVIGMNNAITDEAAIKFIAALYSAIGFGRSIQGAFEQGKLSIKLNGIPEGNIPELLVKSGVDATNITLLSIRSPEGAQSSTGSSKTIPIFISYAPQDNKWRDDLIKHLIMMKRQKLISIEYDDIINAGVEAQKKAAEQLAAARIILLLVSPYYVMSDDLYEGELERALSRHRAGTARVIPIIVRDTEGWKQSPFGHLKALPRDERSIQATGNFDGTFAAIAGEIRRVVDELRSS
jgi:hypothetical protein